MLACSPERPASSSESHTGVAEGLVGGCDDGLVDGFDDGSADGCNDGLVDGCDEGTSASQPPSDRRLPAKSTLLVSAATPFMLRTWLSFGMLSLLVSRGGAASALKRPWTKSTENWFCWFFRI